MFGNAGGQVAVGGGAAYQNSLATTMVVEGRAFAPGGVKEKCERERERERGQGGTQGTSFLRCAR